MEFDFNLLCQKNISMISVNLSEDQSYGNILIIITTIKPVVKLDLQSEEEIKKWIFSSIPSSLKCKHIQYTRSGTCNVVELQSYPLAFLIKHTNCRIDKLELYLSKLLFTTIKQQDLYNYTSSAEPLKRSAISKYISYVDEVLTDLAQTIFY